MTEASAKRPIPTLGFEEDKAVIRTLAAEIPGGADQIERLIAAVSHLDDAPSVIELIGAATSS